jgi:hypothetical protein
LTCAGVEQRCGHLSPRAVAMDFLSSFTGLGLGLHTCNLALVPMLESMCVYLSV